jgi:hypothetical protein
MKKQSISGQLGTVVAARRLKQRGKSPRTSIVRVGKPLRVGTEEWRCPFHVSGIDLSEVQFAYGTDSVQALQNAFIGIRKLLDGSGKRFSWPGVYPANLSFPRTVPWTFGAEFARRVEALLDRELGRFGRELRATRKTERPRSQ